jgi:hypothetical protein
MPTQTEALRVNANVRASYEIRQSRFFQVAPNGRAPSLPESPPTPALTNSTGRLHLLRGCFELSTHQYVVFVYPGHDGLNDFPTRALWPQQRA